MNDVRTVDELERTLKSAEPEALAPSRLTEIRTRGLRRRRGRKVAVVSGAAAAVITVSLGVSAITTAVDGDRTPDRPRDAGAAGAPDGTREMSTLARRALDEIDGAVQVSSWQVAVPEPAGAERVLGPGYRIDPRLVASGPFDGGGARTYTGVTQFAGGSFPEWLYSGVEAWETEHSTSDARPVGSVELGVLVDIGAAQIACVHIPRGGLSATNGEPDLPAHGPLYDPDQPCQVSVVHQQGDHLTFGRNPAPVDLFRDGEEVQVFQGTTELSEVGTLWVGGAQGTDVASVDLVLEDGRTVHPTIASGTMVPEKTVFWGTVPGVLTEVVTRDADGEVLARHTLQPCPQTPDDCRF